MPYNVVPRMDLSLCQLAAMYRNGQSVLKTPHVGNIYPNNLAVANLGIPLLLVDQTIGSKDHNFHPHTIICGGVSEQIADPALMTSHSRITRRPTKHAGRFVPGASLSDAHVRALKDAIPHAHVETTSALATRHANIYLQILRVLTKHNPLTWNRYVNKDGEITARSTRDAESIEREGIHGISEQNSWGWIIPNTWNILIDGVLNAILHGANEVYSLSGPDMIGYIKKSLLDLHNGYDLIRNQLKGTFVLPETMTFNIVPVAEMRFAVANRHRRELDELVDTYLTQNECHRQKGAEIALYSGDQKARRIAELNRLRPQHQRQLQDMCQRCPQIFYDITKADFFSQYDLLDGEELYTHPWGIESPIQDVINAMRLFKRLMRTA